MKYPLCVWEYRLLIVWLCVFGAMLLPAAGETPEEILKQEPVVSKPGFRERLVAKVVTGLISNHHYEPRAVDPAISSQWFLEYFKSLDANRMLFLESDIDSFRSYETVLWNPRLGVANLDFAYEVFALYLKRSREWAVYSIDCLQQPHDFSVDESLPMDYREEPWCKNMDELRDLWRRRVKNALLNEEIIVQKERAEKLKKAQSGQQPADAATAAATAAEIAPVPAKPQDPPEVSLSKSIARNYKRRTELEAIDILELFMSSLTRVYDPHSAYMAPETKENFDINMRLSLQGIGAVLSMQDAYTTVVSIIPGGPADKDGRLKEGDRIIAVTQDGEDAVDVVEMPLNKVVAQIRGTKGTTVHLTILPEGSGTPTQLSLVRDEVKLTDQEAQSDLRTITIAGDGDAKVLVVYLPSFYSDFGARGAGDKEYKSSTRDISRLLEQAAQERPVDGLILDLRGNGGGSLEEAIELAGLFVAAGPVVQVRSSNGKIEKRLVPDAKVEYGGPLVVLVDKFSASASEIVAAALQDYGRAVLIGDQATHGKGTVQTIYDLGRLPGISRAQAQLGNTEPGSLKFTLAKFYRINGSSTQVKGVTPDIVLPSFTDHMDLGESKLPHVLPWDVILPASYQRLNSLDGLLPQLRSAALKRSQEDPLFQEYVRDIAFYADLREQKQLPLQRAARAAFQAKEEEATKMVRKFQAQRKSARKDRQQADKDKDEVEDEIEGGKDLVMEAALGVMADLLREQPVAAAQTTGVLLKDAVPALPTAAE